MRDCAGFRGIATDVGGEFLEAGNQGFRALYRYIRGDSASGTTIAMTAVVLK